MKGKAGDRPFQVDVTAYLPLVERIARRLKGRVGPAPLEDLVSFGTLGLLEAARRYDPKWETPFEAFARPRIRGAIIDGLRLERRGSRRQWERVKKLQQACDALIAEGKKASDEEVCAYLGIGKDALAAWLEEAEHLQWISLDQVVRNGDGDEYAVADLLEDLRTEGPERRVARQELRRILAEAIGRLPEKEQLVLALHYDEGLSLREVASILGVTPARVSQLHSKAILRLRGRLGRFKQELID